MLDNIILCVSPSSHSSHLFCYLFVFPILQLWFQSAQGLVPGIYFLFEQISIEHHLWWSNIQNAKDKVIYFNGCFSLALPLRHVNTKLT